VGPIWPGRPRALLCCENRLLRGEFSHERLDEVTLIAGRCRVAGQCPDVCRADASRARIVAPTTRPERVERDRMTVQRGWSLWRLRLRAAQASVHRSGGAGGAGLACQRGTAQWRGGASWPGAPPHGLAREGCLGAGCTRSPQHIHVEIDVAVRTNARKVEIAATTSCPKALTNDAKQAEASMSRSGRHRRTRRRRSAAGGGPRRRDVWRGGKGSGMLGLTERVEALGGESL